MILMAKRPPMPKKNFYTRIGMILMAKRPPMPKKNLDSNTENQNSLKGNY